MLTVQMQYNGRPIAWLGASTPFPNWVKAAHDPNTFGEVDLRPEPYPHTKHQTRRHDMNSTQHKINDFQVWIESHPARTNDDDPEFLEALGVLDEALSAAFLAAFNLDEKEV
jgi:hypothetical protein